MLINITEDMAKAARDVKDHKGKPGHYGSGTAGLDRCIYCVALVKWLGLPWPTWWPATTSRRPTSRHPPIPRRGRPTGWLT